MEGLFLNATHFIASSLEGTAAVLIAVGALETIYLLIKFGFSKHEKHNPRREAWINFARWLLLGLEFSMAADIVRSAIAPSWTSIGQLAAIALIRTFVSFFLERDVELYIDNNVNKPGDLQNGNRDIQRPAEISH